MHRVNKLLTFSAGVTVAATVAAVVAVVAGGSGGGGGSGVIVGRAVHGRRSY